MAVYDFLVIGGGSGGMAAARKAASYKARVCLIEAARLGGTCVNMGCVPKKVMWNTAAVAETLRDANHYGFNFECAPPKFSWATLKDRRDAYVKRLNGIYENNLKKESVDYIRGVARLKSPTTVEVDGKHIEAKKILVAVGGEPRVPIETVLGAHHGITSDGFFELKEQPRSVAIIGSGYIAVEIAGIFHSLGTEVTVYARTKEILRSFDAIIKHTLKDHMGKIGIKFEDDAKVTELARTHSRSPITVQWENNKGEKLERAYEEVLWAIGRKPSVERLDLEAAGLNTDEKGQIIVDDYQNTNVENIYALGDVCGRVELTPVAIAAGRRLADRLFGGPKFANSKVNYDNIPSVIFSHPTSGACGLTEEQARKRYGDSNVRAYVSRFVNMYNAITPEKPPSAYKLVVTGEDEKVVGLHIIGQGSDEILQGFAVAINVGTTKTQWDNTIAIHPTAAEELVTLR